MKKLKVQVNKENYDFSRYVNMDRWSSYYYQIEAAMNSKGNDILLIGAGDNIVVNVIKSLGKNVTTFDFDKNLNPDICGSVTEIDKILNKKYDVIICCQVLEHIPFELFEPTIEKISKCVKETFILSLPNNNKWTKFCFKNRFLKFKVQLKSKWLFAKRWDINKQGGGEHYWEIDIKGSKYSKKNIDKILSKYYKINKTFIPFENTYHVFYILEKNS